jgi:hypothetical protein
MRPLLLAVLNADVAAVADIVFVAAVDADAALVADELPERTDGDDDADNDVVFEAAFDGLSVGFASVASGDAETDADRDADVEPDAEVVTRTDAEAVRIGVSVAATDFERDAERQPVVVNVPALLGDTVAVTDEDREELTHAVFDLVVTAVDVPTAELDADFVDVVLCDIVAVTETVDDGNLLCVVATVTVAVVDDVVLSVLLVLADKLARGVAEHADRTHEIFLMLWLRVSERKSTPGSKGEEMRPRPPCGWPPKKGSMSTPDDLKAPKRAFVPVPPASPDAVPVAPPPMSE